MSESSRPAMIGRRCCASAVLLCATVAACVTLDPPATPVGPPPATPRSRAPAPDPSLWRTAPRPAVTLPADLPMAPAPEQPIAPRRRRTAPPRDRGLDRSGIVIAVPNPPAQPTGREHPAASAHHATEPRAVTAPTPAAPAPSAGTASAHHATESRAVTAPAPAAPAPSAGTASAPHATEPRAVTAPAPATPAPVPPPAATPALAPPTGAVRTLPAPTPVADGPVRSADWEAGEVFNVVSEADTSTARSERTDEVPGEVIEIELPGTNWIYTGRDARIAFVARDIVGDATAFTFRVAPGSGDVPLEFVATDASSGQTIEHRALVSASDRSTLEPAVTVTPLEAAPRGQNSLDPPGSLGARLQAAITDPTDPTQLSRLAAELIATLTPESDTDIPTDVTVEESDPEDAPLDPLVVPFARVLLAADLSEPAALLLDHPEVFDPRDDTIVFTLAEAYERDRLDLARSRSLYQLLIDRHPFSRHWNAAEARIEYLDRTFFLIR